MTDPKPPESKASDAAPADAEAGTPGGSPDAADAAPPLSKEEQMARFEDQLKEDDWGHQPC